MTKKSVGQKSRKPNKAVAVKAVFTSLCKFDDKRANGLRSVYHICTEGKNSRRKPRRLRPSCLQHVTNAMDLAVKQGYIRRPKGWSYLKKMHKRPNSFHHGVRVKGFDTTIHQSRDQKGPLFRTVYHIVTETKAANRARTKTRSRPTSCANRRCAKGHNRGPRGVSRGRSRGRPKSCQRPRPPRRKGRKKLKKCKKRIDPRGRRRTEQLEKHRKKNKTLQTSSGEAAFYEATAPLWEVSSCVVM